MIRNNLCRLNSLKLFYSYGQCFSVSRRSSSKGNDKPPAMQSNEQQGSYYTAKDVEFCPNRAKDVMQNYVEETSEVCDGEDKQIKTDSATENDKDHMEGYQSGPNVSLYSVMQSNVPEPFSTKDKAPTHLNMPGSSSSQDSKYLSGKMQSTHQSEQ